MKKRSRRSNRGDKKKEVKPEVYFSILPERTGVANYDCFVAAMKMAMFCGGKRFKYLAVPYLRTDVSRNSLVGEFMRMSSNPNDVLVMLDADHKFEYNIVERISSFDPQYGVVGALCFRRGFPFDPLVFSRNEEGVKVGPKGWHENALLKGVSTGTGVIAIRRWVFMKLQEEGFSPPFFRYMYPPPNFNQSEDVFFSECCEVAGIPHYAASFIEAPHLVVEWADSHRWWKHINLLNTVRSGKTSVIIPSAGRPEQAKSCVKQLFASSQGWDIECIVGVEPLNGEDTMTGYREAFDGMDVKMLIFDDWQGPIRAWNAGLAQAQGEYLVFGADDLWFHEGWLPLALDKLESIRDRSGLVGFNDGTTNGELECTHFLMTRDFCMEHHAGVLAFPAYHQYFTDVESFHRASEADRYRWAFKSKVEHLHHAWNKAEEDETYKQSSPHFNRDKEAFEKRLASGFPNDFDPVLVSELS